jgi:WD40 repeat protein
MGTQTQAVQNLIRKYRVHLVEASVFLATLAVWVGVESHLQEAVPVLQGLTLASAAAMAIEVVARESAHRAAKRVAQATGVCFVVFLALFAYPGAASAPSTTSGKTSAIGPSPSQSLLPSSVQGTAETSLEPLTRGHTVLVAADAEWPQISADGQQILYLRPLGAPGDFSVHQTSVGGGEAKEVVSGNLPEVAMAPAGDVVAVRTHGNNPIRGTVQPPGLYLSSATSNLQSLSPDGLPADSMTHIYQDAVTQQGWVVFQWQSSRDNGTIYLERWPTYVPLVSADPYSLNASKVSASPNGDWVVFDTEIDLLGTGVEPHVRDVYRIDVATKTLTLISVGIGGKPANGDSYEAAVADDGTVVFTSHASNLVQGDTNAQWDVFSNRGGVIAMLSRGLNGGQGNGLSPSPEISADGRFAVFELSTYNLLLNGQYHNTMSVFRVRLVDGAIQLVSARADGSSANGDSWAASISGDGSIVAFSSYAPDLVSTGSIAFPAVFVARF